MGEFDRGFRPGNEVDRVQLVRCLHQLTLIP
jgi:hypothetical protein